MGKEPVTYVSPPMSSVLAPEINILFPDTSLAYR